MHTSTPVTTATPISSGTQWRTQGDNAHATRFSLSVSPGTRGAHNDAGTGAYVRDERTQHITRQHETVVSRPEPLASPRRSLSPLRHRPTLSRSRPRPRRLQRPRSVPYAYATLRINPLFVRLHLGGAKHRGQLLQVAHAHRRSVHSTVREPLLQCQSTRLSWALGVVLFRTR